jgi:hypothetical protein
MWFFSTQIKKNDHRRGKQDKRAERWRLRLVGVFSMFLDTQEFLLNQL